MCVNALFFQSFDAKFVGRLKIFFFGTPIKITCSERKFGGSVIQFVFMTTFQDAWEAQCLIWCCMSTRVFFSVVY